MRRILFLDFDGVLNNTRWFVSQHEKNKKRSLATPYNPRDDFDPRNMRNLAALMRAVPDLQVVVSSSWRKGHTLEELRSFLEPHVPPHRFAGNTGEHPTRERHREISQWLAECAPQAHFAALDDDIMDMLPLGEHFFHTPARFGLTRQIARKVARFLLRAP